MKKIEMYTKRSIGFSILLQKLDYLAWVVKCESSKPATLGQFKDVSDRELHLSLVDMCQT